MGSLGLMYFIILIVFQYLIVLLTKMMTTKPSRRNTRTIELMIDNQCTYKYDKEITYLQTGHEILTILSTLF